MHGAMDGAMKFVKGDAIASIIIALVNILAGLAIGTLMKDMSMGEALQRYAILTVGDGMVSQIPSLLVSIAAGIVITRVSSASDATQLAGQIAKQVLAHPRAWVIAGAAVASFLLVPGFPKWVFALLAAAIIAIGMLARRSLALNNTPAWISHAGTPGEETGDGPEAIAAPFAIRFAVGLRGAIDRHALDRKLMAVKTAVEGDLGPVFPLRLEVAHVNDVPDSGYSLLVKDVPVSHGVLRPGCFMLQPQASAAPVGVEVAAPFGPFARVVWIQSATADVPTWTCEDVLSRHVDHVVRRHAPQMIGLQEVQRLLRVVQTDAPDLAAEVSRTVPAQRVADVLRRLLMEGIPVRNLHTICESLTQWGPKEPDAVALTELVRIDLGRYITSRYAGSARQIEAILFESSLLDRVQAAVERSARGNLLLLSPAVTQDVREQVRRILGSNAGHVVAIASAEARRYIKTLVEPVAPELPVLSYQEIDADVSLQPIGWVMNPQVA